MEKELVTVIVPVYNAEKYLAQCVESILNQTYNYFELLLVDDGSTDLSGNICDKYEKRDRRIKVFHQRNRGASAARNFGIDQATGQWITFIDSDDWVERDYIKVLMECNDKADICFVNTCKKTAKKKKNLKDKVQVLDRRKFKVFERCLLNKYVDFNHPHLTSACAKLYKKQFLLQHQIRFPEDLSKSEDAIFNMKAYSNAQKGRWSTAELYNYRMNAFSVTHSYDQKVTETYKKHLRYIKEFYKNTPYPEFALDYAVRGTYDFIYCIVHDFCHYRNHENYIRRKQRFIDAKNEPLFKNSIENIKTKGFSFSERLLIFLIKHNFFLVINFIVRIMQKK